MLQLASLSFDMSVSELLGPLAAGGRVVLAERRLGHDPRALLRTLRERRLTVCVLVPSLLEAVLDQGFSEPATERDFALRLLVSGGEKLPLAAVVRARQLFGRELDVVNRYGPTECTNTATDDYVPATEPTPPRPLDVRLEDLDERPGEHQRVPRSQSTWKPSSLSNPRSKVSTRVLPWACPLIPIR